MILPRFSSSSTSIDSISSSQDPAGGLHGLDVAGGVELAGCVLPRRDRFVVVVGVAVLGVPLVARRRFLVLAAVSVCWKSFSRPPNCSKY
jgi:hypothetical protein